MREETEITRAHEDAPAGPGAAAAASAQLPSRPSRAAAHRRPLAVALYFGYRAIAALLLAMPVSVLAAGLVGGYPSGDAVLFEPGAMMLIEAGRVARAAALPVVTGFGGGLVLAAAVGLIPLSILLAALRRDGPISAQQIAARVARCLGPLMLLWGAALAAEVAAAVIVLLVGLKLVAWLELGAPANDIAEAVVAIAALVLVVAIGAIHDLARAAAVDQARGFYRAAAFGLRAVRSAPFAAALSYGWRAALALLALVGAAWAVHRLGVSTAPRVALAFVMHASVLAVAAYLRASWLAAALRLLDRVDPAPPASDDILRVSTIDIDPHKSS